MKWALKTKRIWNADLVRVGVALPSGTIYPEACADHFIQFIRRGPMCGFFMPSPGDGDGPRGVRKQAECGFFVRRAWLSGDVVRITIEATSTVAGTWFAKAMQAGAVVFCPVCAGIFIPGTTIVDPGQVELVCVDAFLA
jgi:hypothetical protein